MAPQPDIVEKAITELLPDIDILMVLGTIGGVAAKKVAPQMPTVFCSVGAPVEIGLVQSLAHPGGNMTGITFEAAVEAYGEAIADPQGDRAAPWPCSRSFGRPATPTFKISMAALKRAAPQLGITLSAFDVHSCHDLEQLRLAIFGRGWHGSGDRRCRRQRSTSDEFRTGIAGAFAVHATRFWRGGDSRRPDENRSISST